MKCEPKEKLDFRGWPLFSIAPLAFVFHSSKRKEKKNRLDDPTKNALYADEAEYFPSGDHLQMNLSDWRGFRITVLNSSQTNRYWQSTGTVGPVSNLPCSSHPLTAPHPTVTITSEPRR
jgi:hypothetical protein